MGSTALVSLDEYLNTSFEPDQEYVDGVLKRRKSGTQKHGLLQTILAIYFGEYRKSHRLKVFTETRLQMDAARGTHRIPDIMVVETPYQKGKVVVDVPSVVVEIKSPDDTFDEILDKCFEYEKLGTNCILVMDPDNKRAWKFQHGNLQILPGTSMGLPLFRSGDSINFPFGEMFNELDED